MWTTGLGWLLFMGVLKSGASGLTGYQDSSRCIFERKTSIGLGQTRSAQVPLIDLTGLDLCTHFELFDFETVGTWKGDFSKTTEFLSNSTNFETSDGITAARFTDSLVYGSAYTLQQIPNGLPDGRYLTNVEYVRIGSSSICVIKGEPVSTVESCRASLQLYGDTYNTDYTDIPEDGANLPSDYSVVVLVVTKAGSKFQLQDFHTIQGPVITKPDYFMSSLYQARLQILSDCQFHYNQIYNILQTFRTDEATDEAMKDLLLKLPRFQGNSTEVDKALAFMKAGRSKDRVKRSLISSLFGDSSEVEEIRVNTNLHTKNIQLLDMNEKKLSFNARNVSDEIRLLANESLSFQTFVREQILEERHNMLIQQVQSIKMKEMSHFASLARNVRNQVEQESRQTSSLINILANPKLEHCFTTERIGYFCKNSEPAAVELLGGIPHLEFFGAQMENEVLLLTRCLPRGDGQILALNHQLLRNSTEGYMMGPLKKIPVSCLTTTRRDCDSHFKPADPMELPRIAGTFYIIDSHTSEVYMMSQGTAAVVVQTTNRQIQLGLNPTVLQKSDFPIQIKQIRIEHSDLTVKFKSHFNLHKALFLHPRESWISIFSDGYGNQDILPRNVTDLSLQDLFETSPVVKYLSYSGLCLISLMCICALACCVYVCRTVRVCIELGGLCCNIVRLVCCFCKCRSREAASELNDHVRQDTRRIYGRLRRSERAPREQRELPARPPPDYSA